jgi:hypothetical protein
MADQPPGGLTGRDADLHPAGSNSRFKSLLPLLLAVAGVIAWSVSLSSIHPYAAPASGLVSQLSVLWWLGVALAAAGIVLELSRESPRTIIMIPTLIALALILHGTLPATEPVPRFSAAYVVAGFSDYIGRTGTALPRLDVRMSWPAMFAAAGMMAKAIGVSTLWFLRWCPLALNLVDLIPLKVIADTCLRTSRARWAVLAIFLASNWIDQDYFSPQGINVFLFLAAVAIAIRVFAVGGRAPKPVQAIIDSRSWLRLKLFATNLLQLPYGATPNEQPETDTTPGYRVALLAVLLVILGASAVTHQITPAALCLVFFGFALTGRTSLRMLWVFTAVLVWAWLSWEAHTYWAGHLAKILGSAGQIGSTLNSTVGARLGGKSFGRTLVTDSRLFGAALTWLAAMVGWWALWRRGRTMWTMVVVAVAPVFVAGAVSYGGEVALRVLLFSLAPAAVLTASIIDYAPLRKASVVFLLGVGVLLLVLFPLNRFGNESFEAISPGDLAAATWIHVHVPDGAVVYVTNRDEPFYYAKVGAYKLVEFGGLLAADQTELADHLPVTHKPTYIYFTRSQANEGWDYLGYPPDWLTLFTARLLKTGYVHIVYKNSSALVLQIDKSAPTRHHKPVVVPHPKPVVPVTPHPKPTPTTRPKPTHTTRPRPTPTTRPKPPPTTRPKPTTTTTTHPNPTTTTTTTPPTTTTTTPPTTTTLPPPARSPVSAPSAPGLRAPIAALSNLVEVLP